MLALIKALLFHPQGELRPEASQHLHGDSPVLELGKAPPVVTAAGPRKGWVTLNGAGDSLAQWVLRGKDLSYTSCDAGELLTGQWEQTQETVPGPALF